MGSGAGLFHARSIQPRTWPPQISMKFGEFVAFREREIPAKSHCVLW